jgi:hypothetical protein
MVAPAPRRIRKNKSEKVLRTFSDGGVSDLASLVRIENAARGLTGRRG